MPRKTAFFASALFVASAALPALAGSREILDFKELSSLSTPAQLVVNAAFLPPSDHAPALEPFNGHITLDETRMVMEPATLRSDTVLGKDPHLFPGLKLGFVTQGDDLVPLTQDVIRAGSLADGKSFWDIIVQPGKIWSEPDDQGWSRASFPFSLMHSLEGETHNGVATFLYRQGEISALRLQIVTQTSPFYVEDFFTAAASVPARLDTAEIADADAIRQAFVKAEAEATPLLAWSDFVDAYGQEIADGYDDTIDPKEKVAAAISVGGKLYLKDCPTPMGELPYCARQRFGVWSVTKAATNDIALLAASQKYGPEVYDAKIVDLIPEAQGKDGWERVTLGDLVNMSSGMGYGRAEARPYDAGEPYIKPYFDWYEARSTAEKLAVLLDAAKPYPWQPGEVTRYRDEDMFLLGVGLSRYIEQKDPRYHTVWDFLEAEVYGPIGIAAAPTNKTIEAQSADDQALMAFGYYPTLGDMAKLAELFHHGGKFDGQQILDPVKVARIMPSLAPNGLPTGSSFRPYYDEAFWRTHMDSRNGCAFYYPVMTGYGANYVAIFPAGITAIRVAKNMDNTPPSRWMNTFERTADAIADLCQ